MELNVIFMRKYYKRVLSDLIVEFEDFTERTNLSIDIEVLKYMKDGENKDKSGIISKQNIME
jgi:hypothetical protein